jgi:hypothetical protein
MKAAQYRSQYFRIEDLPKEFLHYEVLLHKCENLPAKDVNGFSDPYVVMNIGEENVRSSTQRKTLNPVFNEQFFIAATSRAYKQLNFKVMDWDKLTADDLCGSCAINLNDVDAGQSEFLLDLKPEGGTIHVSVKQHQNIATSIIPADENFQSTLSQKAESDQVYKYGILQRKNDMNANWESKFYILKKNQIFYYKKTQDWLSDEQYQGQIIIEGISIEEEEFENRPFSFNIISRGRDNYIQASSEKEKVEWITAIRDAINGMYQYVKPVGNRSTAKQRSLSNIDK